MTVQMLSNLGDNVFQGRVIEVHIAHCFPDQAFTFTDWIAEMKVKASICISNSETPIESLEIAKSRIQIMIKGWITRRAPSRDSSRRPMSVSMV